MAMVSLDPDAPQHPWGSPEYMEQLQKAKAAVDSAQAAAGTDDASQYAAIDQVNPDGTPFVSEAQKLKLPPPQNMTRPVSENEKIRQNVRRYLAKGAQPTGTGQLRSDTEKANALLAAEKPIINAHVGELRGLQSQMTGMVDELQKKREWHKWAHDMGMEEHRMQLDEVDQALVRRKIDPQRAFPTISSKIMSVIGIAMGAFAQAYSRGKIPNTALQLVNAAIARDLDAQKTEIQKLGMVADIRRNALSLFMQSGRDERTAMQQAELSARNFIDSQINIAKDKYQGILDTHRLDALQQQNTAEMHKIILDNKRINTANALQAASIEASMLERGGGGKSSGADDAFLNQSVLSLEEEFINLPVQAVKEGTGAGGTGEYDQSLSLKLQRQLMRMVTESPGDEPGLLSKTIGLMVKESGGYAKELAYNMTSAIYVGSAIVKKFQGGRPSDLDMRLLLGGIPKAGEEPELGRRQFVPQPALPEGILTISTKECVNT